MGDDINKYMSVEVKDTDLCPRYTARIVKNIKIEPSPAWMRERLHACGVRPINNIVDITNYVMLEYGQPMHAFDYKCLSDGRIVVRRARNGESIQTLDGVDHDLSDKMLAICDNDKPVAVAGVMGGANFRDYGRHQDRRFRVCKLPRRYRSYHRKGARHAYRGLRSL